MHDKKILGYNTNLDPKIKIKRIQNTHKCQVLNLEHYIFDLGLKYVRFTCSPIFDICFYFC